MSAEVLFQTQRKKVLAQFEKAGQPFLASTKPYKSTRQLVATVFDVQNPGGANPLTAFAVFLPNQILEFFAYGIGDNIAYGTVTGTTSGSRLALESDTNQAKGRQTNTEDFIIEGISCSCKGARIAYAAANIPATFTNENVIKAVNGTAALMDPGSLVTPPQVYSPFNLENALFSAVQPNLTIDFDWDRKRTMKVGTLEEIPEGAAKSFLRASGDPRNDNRYRVPEGLIWRREGEPDGLFVAKATLLEPVVVPINLIALDVTAGVDNVPPTHIFLDIVMRVHGLSVSIPSEN